MAGIDDYQWPRPVLTSKDRYFSNRPTERVKLIDDIEMFFRKLFDVEVILVPSGRAAIAIVLKFLGINRSHTVFTPKWTPPCVIDAIGRTSNPNTIYSKDCNVAIAIHKWGQVQRFSKRPISRLIEDSVDSIITSPKSLFPNHGDIEIFSLPKIIGSYTGGLIAVKTKRLSEKIRASIISNNELAQHQSRLRFELTKGANTGFDSWIHLEATNKTLDYNGLVYVRRCLDNYETNRRVIEKRLRVVIKKFADIPIAAGRLPPLIALDSANHPVKEGASVIMRHNNFTGYIDKPEYRQAHLIPLHFGVTDELFFKILNSFS